MNKTTFKVIDQLKENSFYIKLREDDIASNIGQITLKMENQPLLVKKTSKKRNSNY